MGIEGEALETFATDFERSHPGSTVAVQALPWSAAQEKLLTAFAADALPDVIALGNTWLPQFVALRALAPLDDLLGPAAHAIHAGFAATRASVTFEGKLFAMPWYLDTRLLFYRRDLLERAGFKTPPTSWVGWLEQLAAISAASGPDRHGVLMPLNEYEPLVAFCLQADTPLLRDDSTRGGFRQPAVRDCFAYVASLYERGYAPALTSTQVPDLYSAFARGDFAFLISGPWNLGEFARRLPPDMQDKWATAPLPGRDGPGASLSGGVSLCVTSASRRKELAAALIAFLGTGAQQGRLYRITGDLPADPAVWSPTHLLHDPNSKSFYDQLVLAKPPPRVPEWEQIATEMAATLERVVRKTETLDQALSRLDRFADKTLAKRRWLRQRAVRR